VLQRGVRYKQRRWRDRAATVKHGNVKVTRGFIGLKVKPDAMAAFPWAAIPEPRHWLRPGIAGAGLLQLIRTGLAIAVRKRSGFDNRKRPQRLNRATRNHAFVFSGSCNKLPGDLSIASN
jgi:hypothetical protein